MSADTAAELEKAEQVLLEALDATIEDRRARQAVLVAAMSYGKASARHARIDAVGAFVDRQAGGSAGIGPN